MKFLAFFIYVPPEAITVRLKSNFDLLRRNESLIRLTPRQITELSLIRDDDVIVVSQDKDKFKKPSKKE